MLILLVVDNVFKSGVLDLALEPRPSLPPPLLAGLMTNVLNALKDPSIWVNQVMVDGGLNGELLTVLLDLNPSPTCSKGQTHSTSRSKSVDTRFPSPPFKLPTKVLLPLPPFNVNLTISSRAQDVLTPWYSHFKLK